MNEIIFKVAPKGEGKTKWLLTIAKYYSDKGRCVYLFTADDKEYIKFCEKYFNVFKEVCPVQKVTGYRVTKDDVVLVDNMLNQNGTSIEDYAFFNRNCYKLFVTLEGVDEFQTEEKSWDEFYEQLTLDIQEVIRA